MLFLGDAFVDVFLPPVPYIFLLQHWYAWPALEKIVN